MRQNISQERFMIRVWLFELELLLLNEFKTQNTDSTWRWREIWDVRQDTKHTKTTIQRQFQFSPIYTTIDNLEKKKNWNKLIECEEAKHTKFKLKAGDNELD